MFDIDVSPHTLTSARVFHNNEIHNNERTPARISANYNYILLTKITAAQNGVALSYHNVRGLYFLAVIFVGTIVTI